MILTVYISTPDHNLFHGEVSALHIPLRDGIYEVLPNHMDMFFELGMGGLYAHTSHGLKSFFIQGGVAMVEKNICRLSVLSFEENENSDSHQVLDAQHKHLFMKRVFEKDFK